MSAPKTSAWWPKVGGVIVVCVCLYYGFVAVNSLSLPHQTGEATVIDKEYLAAGTTYQTRYIGGRRVVQPVGTEEAWVLVLRLDDVETIAMVERPLYDGLSRGEEVRATYTRGRITGAMRVLEVRASSGGGGGGH